MISKAINILKQVAEENKTLCFTFYTDKSKKSEKHNKSMMNMLSILDGTDYPFTVIEKSNRRIIFEISNDAVKYMINYLNEGEK